MSQFGIVKLDSVKSGGSTSPVAKPCSQARSEFAGYGGHPPQLDHALLFLENSNKSFAKWHGRVKTRTRSLVELITNHFRNQAEAELTSFAWFSLDLRI